MNRFFATLLVFIIVVGGVFLWEYRDAPWLAPYLGVGSSAGQSATTTTTTEENWNTFASSTLGYSIEYPTDFTPDTSYIYSEMGPGKDISGVKFTIPAAMATGTNLGSDSYISVEQLPSATSCTADEFLQLNPGDGVQTITDNGVTYSVASSTGAGAGNRYEEWAWAIPGTNPCLAVRYFIHYGVIENYPPGMVQQFNEAALLQEFDAIRHSLVIGK